MSRFDAGLISRALAAIGKPPPAPERNPADAVAIAAGLARRFEGLALKPYLCPAGVPTIGYGATHYPDGQAVTLRDQAIDQAYAERMLISSLRREYLPAVLRLCPAVDAPGRLAALIDFAFNLGPGKLKNSTLRRRVNEGRWQEVPDELRKWVSGGGRELPGLRRRRSTEIALL